MKVAHVPFTFAPDAVGGTEIYVEALAKALRGYNIEPVILAPSSTGRNETYEHGGLRVRRYRVSPAGKSILRELYGEGDPEAAAAFGKIIDEERPNAVHVHAFTRAVSVLVVRAAKRRGLPVFFTYHTPTVSCQRGTLMLWGKEACDGELNARRCTRCLCDSRRVPFWAAICLSHVPRLVAGALEKAPLKGRMWTALRMSNLVGAQHEAFRALMEEVDGVVALREWVRTLLVRNGVPDSKITLSRHGLSGSYDVLEQRIDVNKTPLRVAFLGRADAAKGADTLVKALRARPGSNIELHIYGVTQSTIDKQRWAALKALAAEDIRVSFFSPIPNHKVVSLLRGYHVLAVPSRWMEIGPLVVLEAFAAGTPVIGSDLGGIAEWVRHQENGLLVAADDVQAWAQALDRCAKDRCFLARLCRGISPPVSMTDVASEMADLYSGRPSSSDAHSAIRRIIELRDKGATF